MRGVDKVYDTFTTYVAEGRNLPIERVLEIAGGRVWSGADALEIGLIDGYGGLKAAIAVAADKAGLGDDFRVTEAVEPPRVSPPSWRRSTCGLRRRSNARSWAR